MRHQFDFSYFTYITYYKKCNIHINKSGKYSPLSVFLLQEALFKEKDCQNPM